MVFFLLKIFGSFGFFFIPPSFVGAPLIIEDFFFLHLPPNVVWSLLIIKDFCISLALASQCGGVILAKVISKIVIRLKRGLQKDIF